MKKTLFILICILGQFGSYGQKNPEATFEFSFLGADFVDKSSFGFGIGVNRYWHQNFEIGLQLQSAFNRQNNTYGYVIGSPYYSATSLTLANSAQLFKLGRLSMQANANFGWLFLSLQDENFQEFDPIFGIFEPETIANETFRFLQGGLTLNYIINQRGDIDVVLFFRALYNQSLGNVRFGGEDANSGMQFNLGVKLNVF